MQHAVKFLPVVSCERCGKVENIIFLAYSYILRDELHRKLRLTGYIDAYLINFVGDFLQVTAKVRGKYFRFLPCHFKTYLRAIILYPVGQFVLFYFIGCEMYALLFYTFYNSGFGVSLLKLMLYEINCRRRWLLYIIQQ